MLRPLSAACAGVLTLLAAALPLRAQDAPPTDTAWTYRSSSDMMFYRECPAAELVIATKKSLLALDAVTGKALWELSDLPSVSNGLTWGVDCDNTTGISYRQDKLAAVDLVAGRRRWDERALPPFQEVRGTLGFFEPDLLLLFLRTPASDRSLVALRLSSGERVWQRDDLFAQPVRFAGRGGVSDIVGIQRIIQDSDSTLILYLNPEGPLRLDLRSGATVWKSDALAGLQVPTLDDYAAMRVVDSTLVVPRDKGLVALDTRDGSLRWNAPTLLPNAATRLFTVPSGLLVRAGRSFVTVIDPVTGTPRWAQPFTAPTDGAAYAVVGDRYFVVTRGRLVVLDLATGDSTGLADLRFDGGESADAMFAIEGKLVIVSRQNLFLYEPTGTEVYHRYFKAPGASFFEVLSGTQTWGARLGSAALRSEYAYFITNAPDSAGRTGNSLVRVALADGSEAGRIWFKERSPNFRPDTGRDHVLVFEGAKTLVALRFPR